MTKLKNISTNPINGKAYAIPELLDDRLNIDDFLQRNNNGPVVVVQGLGFVGAVMCLVCANSQRESYAVMGVDLPREDTFWKIRSINEGDFPVVASDPKIDEYYEASMKKGNLLATYDPYAYSKADVVIVDINLDVKKQSGESGDLEGFDVDLSGFKNAIKEIGKYCREDVFILVETTVPPGTSKNIVQPLISESLASRGLKVDKFKVGHSYERVMPGPDYIDSIENFYRVYSGVDMKSEEEAEFFLKTIISTDRYPLTKLESTNASEMSKVLENSYRAMNIAFMVEWSRFAERSGVNLYEVIDAIKMRPTHQNMMYPGLGVGGYCLTKDPLLASWAAQNFFNYSEGLKQSEVGVMINDMMPLFAFGYLKTHLNQDDLQNKNTLLLGVSYRSNVADTRYTPVEKFYKFLKKNGSQIYLHDPFVRYWEEMKLEIENDYTVVLKNHIDIVVITTAHSAYQGERLIECLMSFDKLFILDTVGIMSEESINKLSTKHVVRALGRGDLN